jgi:manganese/zinc/iron transport system permease protein
MFHEPFIISMVLACLASVVCSIPGTFLVLRGVALMSDAISHTLLFGIVMTFLCVQTLHTPLLFVGAVCSGLMMVFVVECIVHTRRMTEDVAIGTIFPIFFSLGVILMCLFVHDVHLDVDMVLLGDLAFAPFDRFICLGVDCGPWGLWILSSVLFIHGAAIFCMYYALQYAFFDMEGASIMGVRVRLVQYGLMAITALSAVAACHVVGSIVVVALMITPPAGAYLLTERVFPMLMVSIFIGICASLCGYGAAQYADVSIAGSIAAVNGLFFLWILFFAPRKGIIGTWWYGRACRRGYAEKLVKLSFLKK